MDENRDYKNCIAGASLSSTGFSYTLSLINGKYKMTILDSMCDWGEKNRLSP